MLRLATIDQPDGAQADLDDELALHRWLLLSRAIEDRLRSMYLQGRLRGRLISGRGQEAIPVGAAATLQPGDVAAPVHRDLGVHLVLGTPVVDVFRHYLGRVTSLSRGRDGDIHMGDWSRGIFPMVSHLPDSWPVLGGVALGFRLRDEDKVAMCFCGDGATSTGAWHEAVNFAAVGDLPMVLVVENNGYAYSTPVAKQFRSPSIVARAEAYGIAGELVDGNDVVGVRSAARRAVAHARSGKGPYLLEARTMRMDGHAIHDGADYVPRDELERWAARDPIKGHRTRLLELGVPTVAIDDLAVDVRAEVDQAVAIAESEPVPDPLELEVGVYAP